MPDFVPTAGAVRVEMRFTQQGQKVENVYHVFGAGYDPTGPDMIILAEIFKAWFDDSMQPLVVQNLSLNSIACTNLNSAVAPAIEYTTGLPFLGAITTGDLPMNVTLAVRWLTLFRGRSFRGRTYHLGLPAAQITASQVLSGHRTALQSAYNDLINLFSGEAFELCVLSMVTGGSPRVAGQATPIISVSIEDTLDSQRRRLPGRGQ